MATKTFDAVAPFDPRGFINPEWSERGDYSSVLPCMEKGELVYSCDMRTFLNERKKTARFNNEVHYGILHYQDTYVAVAYKPKTRDDVSAAYAEKVAYDIYERVIAPHTGNHFIPPTTVRTMPDGRVASCQFFVETKHNEDMWNPEFRESVFKNASHERVLEMSVFNAVFNSWDRHPGNYLATQREGVFYLASIDNEGVENKGFLRGWGERSYIPIAFSEDEHANIVKTLELPSDLTLESFSSALAEYGFLEVPRVKAVFNNVINRANGNRICLISYGTLSVCFHNENPAAFPLPKPPYSQTLLEIYQNLNRTTIEDCFKPLIKLDPERFGTRVSDIFSRRDLFLHSASSSKL
ncbi:MAG: hypothetical protein HKM07_01325 [Chlamydiae bacterium]|nr:hypothetical protein [Chlamydiota bacterium]